ncbi:phasin family protein [Oceaniglobus indicus]|uniref:phasin family protein n=1 Tax=Oceaniglobus indicus TaxID=2047749 RepID=UPI000C199406|nr:phasin family protein [Oceaniglobus indicus]
MANPKNPFDPAEMFKAFDPAEMGKMFQPQNMMSMFQPQQTNPFDMEGVIKANQRNFEALTEANKSAAEAYKDMLDKQMEVFGQMTMAVRQQYEWAEGTADADKLKAKTAAMNEAVEEALAMMKKLADTAREANEQAYASVKGQVSEAVEEISKKNRK